MKTRGALAVVVIVLFLSVVPNAEASRDDACTLASLHGSYGFTSTGTLKITGFSGPVANVGVFTFDGEGNLSQDLTNIRDGMRNDLFNLAGTYTVNADCTGSWVRGVTAANFVIVAGGREVMFIRTDPGATVTGLLRKQFRHDKKGDDN